MILDLFAGPGGWDEGAKPLGLHPIGVEWDAAACRTGKAAGHHRVRADVSQLSTAPMVGRVTGLIASPPCQTFSMAGKGAGRDALPELQGAVERVWKGATPAETCPPDLDVKSVLVLEPVRYARDLRPEWIALEQVPAVLPIWQAFAVLLRHDGYSVWCGVLNAADYGVPQTRQRAILIASRVRKVAPPPPTHTKGGEEPDLFGDQLDTWVSMAEALGWGMHPRPCITVTAGGSRQGGPDPLDGGSGARETVKREREEGRWVVRTSLGEPDRSNGGGHHELDPHERPAHTVTTKVGEWQVRDARWDGPGGVDPDGPATTVTADPRITARGHHDHGSQGRNAVPSERVREWYEDRPATTVVGSFSPDVIAAPGYRTTTSRQNAEGSVKVTLDEAAQLQSFPQGYPWHGSKSKQFEQVGNAVPPLLATHVLAAVTGLSWAQEVAA